MSTGEVHVVLPGGVDDPAVPSGGNTYDRRVCRGLADTGRTVRPVAVPGSWPRPGPGDLAALGEALSAVPDRGVVLLDGLVACAAPDVVVPHADRLRLVVLVHLPLADETGLTTADAAALDAAERRTLRAADAVVATSAAVGRRLVGHHGLDAARVHEAAPGVDPDLDPAPVSAGGGRLLCLASVTPRKGHDVLVAALATLADLPWTCVCVGPRHLETYADRIRRQASGHGLADRVHLVGPRTGVALDESFAAADLLVLASRSEPYGMVVTEALARGLPVVATAVDGLPEALGHAPDGSLPGVLVPPEDPAALAAALRDWLTDGGHRRRLRAAAAARRTTLRRWEETTSALDAVLTQVTEAR